ncbi:zinc finger BED domain-containing protein RICESLEEPER 2-like [Primulina eburnea]|uniref:zinc finger BED domain-containing protein RICESLEEPER 2-like n=1 Tax=Primulina eburnea TaxID=1245227 RepID=UPI003C6CBC4C
MCLAAHFVDANCNLHKSILNFCPISGHKSEEIGKCIERCLLDSSIGTIFSITVDNASSNDGAIVYLQKKFDNWGNNILGGKYVHVRCIAHIINLVVQDGLKGNDEHVAISRVREAVRYIRLESADFELNLMAKRMKEKYDKYWGSTEKMNMILYYAVILDPRHKLEFVEFSFDRMYGNVGKNETMKEQVRLGLYELFGDYKLRHSNKLPDTSKSLCSSSNSSTLGSQVMSKKRLCEAEDKSEMAIRLSLKQEFKIYKSGGKGEVVKSELEKYLVEDVEEEKKNFNILQWWKDNSLRFPILSRMARDILAVPISTVALEAAFRTGGRAQKDNILLSPKKKPEPERIGYPKMQVVSRIGSGSGNENTTRKNRVPDPNYPKNPTLAHPYAGGSCVHAAW